MLGAESLSFALVGAAVAAWAAVVGVGVWYATRAAARAGSQGWSALADWYPTFQPPNGEMEFRGETVQVGSVCARNCAVVDVGPGGLYLKAPWHRAALIPLSDVVAARETKRGGRVVYRIRVGDPVVSEVTVSAAVFDAVWAQLQARAAHGVPSPVLEVATAGAGAW